MRLAILTATLALLAAAAMADDDETIIIMKIDKRSAEGVWMLKYQHDKIKVHLRTPLPQGHLFARGESFPGPVRITPRPAPAVVVPFRSYSDRQHESDLQNNQARLLRELQGQYRRHESDLQNNQGQLLRELQGQHDNTLREIERARQQHTEDLFRWNRNRR
jgi:hypothetical protein